MVTSSATLTDAEYGALVADVRAIVDSTTPPGATVLVVSKGDEALVALPGRHGWHFPRAGDGRYAGFYPADSEAAIAELEQLRDKGAGYFVLPQTAFWWLDHYQGLRDHIESHHELFFEGANCRVYSLRDPTPGQASCETSSLFSQQVRELVLLLVPEHSSVALFTGPTTDVDLGRPADRIHVHDGVCECDHFNLAAARGARFAVVPAQLLVADPPPARLVTHQHSVCMIFELGVADA
jgi:hypothetical protein